MDLLPALLQHLEPGQIQKIQTLNFSPTERKYLNSVFKDERNPTLKLSAAHRHKLNTVVVRELLDGLFDDPLDSIRWLHSKSLFKHMGHRMLQAGKAIGKDKRCSFYMTCFRLSLDVPFRFFNHKLALSMGKMLIMYQEEDKEATRDYVRYHLLFAECNRAAAGKDPVAAFTYSVNSLENALEKMKTRGHHLARFYILRTLCSYYTYIKKDASRMFRYLEDCLAIEPLIRKEFQENMRVFLQLQKADAFFQSGDPASAAAIYETMFRKGLSSGMYGLHYHVEQYAMICMCLGKFSKAEQLIRKYFSSAMEEKLDIFATRGALTACKLALYRQDLRAASQHLHLANEVNEKVYYLPFNVQCRTLECFLFLLKKDADFAFSLCTKNLKFLQSQKDKKPFHDYKILWTSVIHLIQASFRHKNPDIKDKEAIKNFQKQYMNLYGQLPLRAVEDLVK